MTGVRYVPADEVRRIVRSILEAAGTPGPAAEAVAGSLVAANLAGHDSHGVHRVPAYVAAIERGAVDPAAVPEVVERVGATCAVSGRRGFGQPAARLAVAEAARLCRTHRAGVVAVRDCNHIGRLGEYAETLAGEGLVAMVLGNADPTVAPYGGRERLLGTNPLAWAVPRGPGAPPVVMDWATAAMAEGKVALSRATGRRVPEGVIVDRHGRSSIEPADFYDGGALRPFGGHKGYGLSVLIEMIGGMLTGAGISALPGYDGTFGTVVIAIDIAAFVPLDRFTAQVEEFCGLLARSAPAEGFPGVLVPGDPEERARRERTARGIPFPSPVWQDILTLATRLGASTPSH